jgi:pimeloyl-ACP methyl ester carboxylesterase
VTDFVLVHGAGTGGWLWDDVANRLRAAGHRVLAPGLRGVGEQSADDGTDVRLSDHIDQVVELVVAERLDRIVLVGFSYGGFVVTGAADRLGTRVSRLIYVEAFLPIPGRSFFDLLPDPVRQTMQRTADEAGGGRRIPPAPVEMVGGIGALEPGVARDHVEAVLARRGFQPIGTYTEPFPVRPNSASPTAAYVSCTDKPAGDPLIALAASLRARGWPVTELPTGHFAMLTMPAALARLLTEQ